MTLDSGEDLAGEGPATAIAPRWPSLAALRRRLDGRWAGIRTLSKFMMVGAGGYLVYQIVLFIAYDSSLLSFLPAKDTSADLVLFTHGDLRLLLATLIAAELAIIGGFTAHTNWTFRERSVVRKPLWLRFGQFNAKALVSTGGIMTAVVNLLVVWGGMYHVLAVPIGVLAGFTWNWTWDSQFIFRRSLEKRSTV